MLFDLLIISLLPPIRSIDFFSLRFNDEYHLQLIQTVLSAEPKLFIKSNDEHNRNCLLKATDLKDLEFFVDTPTLKEISRFYFISKQDQHPRMVCKECFGRLHLYASINALLNHPDAVTQKLPIPLKTSKDNYVFVDFITINDHVVVFKFSLDSQLIIMSNNHYYLFPCNRSWCQSIGKYSLKTKLDIKPFGVNMHQPWNNKTWISYAYPLPDVIFLASKDYTCTLQDLMNNFKDEPVASFITFDDYKKFYGDRTFKQEILSKADLTEFKTHPTIDFKPSLTKLPVCAQHDDEYSNYVPRVELLCYRHKRRMELGRSAEMIHFDLKYVLLKSQALTLAMCALSFLGVFYLNKMTNSSKPNID